MASPTYRVRVDWGGQTGVLRVGTGHIGGPELIFGGSPSDLFLGAYDSPLSDVTTDVLTGKIQRKLGNDGIVEGTLDLTLTDSWPGKYNAKNPDSPLYGLILPAARCEVDVSFDAGATWEPIFGGWLNESESEADYGSSQARINFTDLAYLDRTIDAIPSTGPTTVAAALGLVHDAIGWAGPRDFASADAPLSDFSTDGSTTARQAIADIIKVDLGYYYVARDSTATYVDKYEYARRQSSGTFEATGQTTPGVSLSSIVNRASATGPSGITQSYEDTPSRNKYGPLTDPQGDVQSDWFADDSHALANAQWRVQVAKDPVGAYWQFQPMPTDDKAVTVLDEVLTVSGNEITDAVRALDVQGDGRQDDSSFGIWPAATNLCTNGGFETDATGWTTASGDTINRITSRSKFGAACGRYTLGSATNSYLQTPPVAIAGATAGLVYTTSVWLYGEGAAVGMSIDLILREWGGATGAQDSTTLFVLAAGWQRVSVSRTIVQNDRSLIQVFIDPITTNVGAHIDIDGAQIETGTIATPYIETAGSTSTRSSGRVQAPATLLEGAQGWFAARVRYGFSATDNPYAGAGINLFYWATDGNNRFQGLYDPGADEWVMRNMTAGVSMQAVSAVQSPAVGDAVTVVFVWTATQVGVSVNGAAFAKVTPGARVLPTGSTFDIGSAAGGQQLAGDVLWAACGTGALTDNDALTLHTLMLGGADPDALKTALDHPSWGSTAYWAADTAAYELVNYPGTTQQEAAILAELFDVVTIAPVDLPAEDQQTQWVIHDFGGGAVHKVTWRLRELPATRPIIVGVSAVGSDDVIATG